MGEVKNKVNENLYIMSAQASDIYNHSERDMYFSADYNGMIPYSLELEKLKKVMKDVHSNQQIKDDNLKINKVKSDKYRSNAVINIKFKSGVDDGETIKHKMEKGSIPQIIKDIRKIEEKRKSETKLSVLDKLDKQLETKNKILDYKLELARCIKRERYQAKYQNKWQSKSPEQLRKYLYENGFNIVDEDGVVSHYVVYKRSSAKSRNGECLFILDSIAKQMINWSRMGIEFDKNTETDLASLLAYESLVSSSIKRKIHIDPESILIVDDVESTFNKPANIVKTDNETKHLDSFHTDNGKVVNSLFDGESLLESDEFEGNGMMLVRQHMFKSCCFNTNLQDWFKYNAEQEGIDYDEYTVTDMFGDKMLAKDVTMVSTPSSLKSLKFSDDMFGDKENPEKEMFKYWKKMIKKDYRGTGAEFGVCKSEHKSKRGYNNGEILQQTSYQMLNSMPLDASDIEKLSEYEKEYIHNLKTDDDKFIQYLEDNSNEINANSMMFELYKCNPDIAHTGLFRKFRATKINDHIKHVKKGKLRLPGDYCVLFGNCLEFLKHSVNKFDINDKRALQLKENQVHTTLFPFGDEYVMMRNPHTSPSNVVVCDNTYVDDINTYFNLNENIVCVNAIDFQLQDYLSGCDYDSDSAVIFNHPNLLSAAKKVYGKFDVCLNELSSKKASYKPNNTNMYEIDKILANSTRYIGKTVNGAQQAMSYYWDIKGKKHNDKRLKNLLQVVDVGTVLSCVAIDQAKKLYDIDVQKEITNMLRRDIYKQVDKRDKNGDVIIKKKEIVKQKANPLFFRDIKDKKNGETSVRYYKYNTAMDHLYKHFVWCGKAESKDNKDILDMLVYQPSDDVNYKQYYKVMDYFESLDERIKGQYAKNEREEERDNGVDDIFKTHKHDIAKLKIKPDTMYAIILSIFDLENVSKTRLLKVLYEAHQDTFINLFQKI